MNYPYVFENKYRKLYEQNKLFMENITKISDRIKQFIDYKKLTINKFSDAVGTSNSYFNKLIKNETNIGSDKIENILQAFPEINPIWLVTGKGKMILSDMEKVSPPKSSNITNDSEDKNRSKSYEIIVQENKLLEEKIEMLNQMNDFLQLKIDYLVAKVEFLEKHK